MDACSIWQKLLHRRRIAMRSPAWLASRELPSPSCPRTCRDNSSRSIRCSTRRSMPSHLPSVHGKPKERHAWAVEQLRMGAKASQHLGLKASVSFTGALAWPFVYPWPPRPPGLIEGAFAELARRWRPILDAYEDAGCRHLLRDPSERGHFSTAPLSRCSSTRSAGTGVLASTMIRRTSSCSTSTIWNSSTSTTSGSRHFMSRTPSSIRPVGRASIPVSSPG